MKKDRLFWYFLIPWLLIITLFISLSPWLAELFSTPEGRVFTGINRWSTDYYIYLSYVEQGVRGFLTTKLIFTIQPHSAVFFYLTYAIPGYIFGHILGLNSIFIYHFFRALYGLIFLSVTIAFFYKLSRSKIVTLIAFFLTFYVSGFVTIGGIRYLDWLQEQNIIGRATGPLHYSVGFIIFIATFLFYFYSKTSPTKKAIIFGLLLNGLLLSNPFNFLLMALCFAIYLPIKFLFNKKDGRFLQEFTIIFAAFLISVPLFLLLNYYLSVPPWGVVGVSPKFYVRTTPPISLLEIVMSVGPIFFLGIFGAIRLLVGQPHKQMNVIIFLIIWPIVQFILLIFGDVFKIHPARAFSGLYYLPLAYFSAQLINLFIKNYKKQLLVIFFLFLLTLPNYCLSFKEQLFAFTDFKYFSPFIYPSKNQVQAFQFLEKNTPPYSNVLALFEAGTLINGFSGNSTEVSVNQDFKTPFYANKLNNDEAIKLLKKYHYKYVYFGYQEKYVGGNMSKYPFLKKIYENPESTIYEFVP